MTGRLSMLAIVLATGAAQVLPVMPDAATWMWLALGVLGLSLWLLKMQRPARALIPVWAAVLGLLLAVVRIEQRLADELAAENENRVSRVVLRVASLVRLRPDSRAFEAEVISSLPEGVPSRIYVSWTAPGRAGPYGRFNQAPAQFPELIPGQIWRMSLTLKKLHGARNPNAFDYEAYMFAQGVRATGSVRGTPKYQGDDPWVSLEIVAQRARHRVRQAMRAHLDGMRYGAVLLALAIGDQASVESADWQVFNRTGITHLVSISGSHITMIAALGGLVVLWSWRRLRFRGRNLAERVPAQIAAAMAALLVAWLYCLLAGWGVPARRTFLMLAVVAAAHLLRLPMNGSRLLSVVVLAVVMLDPWALFASGFWLSFGAVCVLMASSGWVGNRIGLPAMTRMQRLKFFLTSASRLQLAITVALMPLLALIFHQISFASPLANAYAIPLISLVVTPLSLLLAALAFVPGLGWMAGFCGWLAHTCLDLMMIPTVWLADFNAASIDVAHPPLALTLLALLGLVLALMPYGFPARRAAWILILPALCWRPERPPEGGWDAFALDVGQSAAIVVQTARHVLLFDTGLRSSAASDEGARTIWPFLQSMGIRKLDVMVVSHADIDHAGGARSLLEAVQIEQSYSSFDLGGYLRREAHLLGRPQSLPRFPWAMSECVAGHAWTIDGVDFQFLWPPPLAKPGRSAKAPKPNDRACVLLIRGRDHSLLLTSDIGAVQEALLLRRGLDPVDVVLAAHHGSRYSSSPGFVQAMKARHVLAQAGLWNRYGHPGPEVVQRWEQAGATFWRTDRQGAITVRSRQNGLRAYSTREYDRRYWAGR
ncbi:competence protein ComEC [Paralcaligenes ureilyticus]|uniref:Competence protein ComEC n=1 Tax=Paralcaligenes ureilyticus TaxID=627131 RepID=A0A4R3M028_9BURK|nr:competence protein ComEC [Paralcaligenes ureilyticus]